MFFSSAFYEAEKVSYYLECLDLRGKFSAIHREYSPNPRKFYAFCTSVTDTATTSGILASGTFSTWFIQQAQVWIEFMSQCATWWSGNTSSNLNCCNHLPQDLLIFSNYRGKPPIYRPTVHWPWKYPYALLTKGCYLISHPSASLKFIRVPSARTLPGSPTSNSTTPMWQRPSWPFYPQSYHTPITTKDHNQYSRKSLTLQHQIPISISNHVWSPSSIDEAFFFSWWKSPIYACKSILF